MHKALFCYIVLFMSAILSIVATPIGNLEDITKRAQRVLYECDAVLCEDTRVTRKLMKHLGIEKPLVSYHTHSGDAKYKKIFSLLEEGKHLVLVSDAGTPSISDPGAQLVEATRARFPTTRIEAVPGASALTAALSVAGVPANSFLFLGFPPHKKGRQTFFSLVKGCERTVVLYESPHRIVKTLTALCEQCDATRTVAVCRELTKIHESIVRGTPEQVLHYYTEQHPDEVRGEFVVVVGPQQKTR